MTKDETKQQIKDWMIEGIQSVLTGEVEHVELLFTRPADVSNYIKSIGGEDLNDMDTNGWQWDYWMTFKVDDKDYMLSGDGFYGNTATFGFVKSKEKL